MWHQSASLLPLPWNARGTLAGAPCGCLSLRLAGWEGVAIAPNPDSEMAFLL